MLQSIISLRTGELNAFWQFFFFFNGHTQGLLLVLYPRLVPGSVQGPSVMPGIKPRSVWTQVRRPTCYLLWPQNIFFKGRASHMASLNNAWLKLSKRFFYFPFPWLCFNGRRSNKDIEARINDTTVLKLNPQIGDLSIYTTLPRKSVRDMKLVL